uniref:Short coiled-coil protein b n=1 Tax=Callorhinchus milii TaxID=7868 RepID=A0A4W3H0H8_CALMI
MMGCCIPANQNNISLNSICGSLCCCTYFLCHSPPSSPPPHTPYPPHAFSVDHFVCSADLSARVDAVKEENLKLKSENQVLGQYIENLMSASSVFQTTDSKNKRKPTKSSKKTDK